MKRILIAALAAAAALMILWLIPQNPALPEASDVFTQAARGLDDIAIEAVLDTDAHSMRVRQTLRLRNRTGQSLNAAVLRTWPNAFQTLDTSPCAQDDSLYDAYYPGGFSAGALVMAHAEVDGGAVVYRYTDAAKTVLSIPVPGGWQPEAETVIQLEYTLQIPRMAYRFGEWDGIWALGNAFAIPAVWEDGAFRTDAYAPVGDPFVSDCANYAVTVTVPRGFICAGSASPAVEMADGQSIYRFSAPAVRDFALVISDRFHTAQALEDDVLLTAYAADAALARELLGYAKKALSCYEKRFGPYPYQSLALAEIHFPHGGMEYPSLTMISADGKDKRALEYLVAHEVAHQWWYAVVGSDGWHQAWQDEALCEFSLFEYAQDLYGAGEREDLEFARAHSAMRVTVSQGQTPGAPLTAFPTMSEYALVVYDRGAACMLALDMAIPGGLDGFLRDYYQTYAFLRASRADFEALLTESTGEDFAPLMRDYLDTHILN